MISQVMPLLSKAKDLVFGEVDEAVDVALVADVVGEIVQVLDFCLDVDVVVLKYFPMLRFGISVL
jgi:hypothetical protein